MKGHGAAELLTDGMVPSEVHNETLGESEGYRAFYQKVAASFGGSEIWPSVAFFVLFFGCWCMLLWRVQRGSTGWCWRDEPTRRRGAAASC